MPCRLAEFPSDCNATCVAAPGLSCLDQRGLPVAPCEVKALVDTNAVTGGVRKVQWAVVVAVHVWFELEETCSCRALLSLSLSIKPPPA